MFVICKYIKLKKFIINKKLEYLNKLDSAHRMFKKEKINIYHIYIFRNFQGSRNNKKIRLQFIDN